MHSQYQLDRSDNIAEQFKDNMNRNIFEGTRLASLFGILDLIKKKDRNAKLEFRDLRDNWIKYDFEDLRRRSQQSVIFER
ncbi:unnamed protein product [Onchocerca flexuosa]|nr:unnamed protein product [Onchocerca flexuosa]